jgi:serine/threonine-protein kinase RsbW
MTDRGSLADFSRSIKVKPETAHLADVREFVEDVAADVDLDPEKIFDLKVAVSEACANAVKHAGRQTKALDVTAVRRGDRLTFTVTDNGVFHPPAAGKGDDINQGIGLPLMVALMDEVTFSRMPGGGTAVSLSVIVRPLET